MGNSMVAPNAKVRELGPYSRPHTLAKLDRRTREARLLESVRQELTAHVGNAPSATQRALIERCAQLSLRCAIMDQRFAETNTQTEHDTRTYLAWSNSLSRTMRELGVHAAPARPRTLADHLAAKAAAA
jgi:hypothetical protein